MTDDQFRTLLKELRAIRHASTATGVATALIIGLVLGGSMTSLFSRLFP